MTLVGKELTVTFTLQAVALGEGWIAAATDLWNIRLFTIGGVQKEMFFVHIINIHITGSSSWRRLGSCSHRSSEYTTIYNRWGTEGSVLSSHNKHSHYRQ